MLQFVGTLEVNQSKFIITKENFMNRIFQLFIVGLALLLSGCATYKPVPEGYSGPVATIMDTGQTEDGTKARIFYVASIDNNEIANARNATRRSSYGTGMSLHMRTTERQVPIRPMRLKLVGTHVVAAPIHEFASRAIGTFFEVEGEINFTPEAGATYLIKGDLQKKGSSVWIEEVGKDGPVAPKIIGK
jgi:hypothetical protein